MISGLQKISMGIILFTSFAFIIVMLFQPVSALDTVPISEHVEINPVQNHFVNESLIITGTTNIPPDSELIIEIYPANRSRTIKGVFTSGTAGRVTVIQGPKGNNTWSFPVDPSDFQPDTYRIDVSSYTSGLLDSAQFRVSGRSCDSENCSTMAPLMGDTPAMPITPSASCQGLTPALAISVSLVCFVLCRARICQGHETGK